jgi:hypothetical protein
MFCKSRIALAASLLSMMYFCPSEYAFANNGGVHGPNVKADTHSAEFRMNTSNSNDSTDGREQYRVHYQRAFNDRFQVRMVLQYRDFDGFEYDNAKAEFLYNYKKANSDNYAAAVRIDARTRRGQRPEDIAIHWTHQYNINKSLFVRGIAILDKNITENGAGEKPMTVASRFSITKRLDNGIMIGAEMYNSYGELNDISDSNEQQHQLGPTIMYSQDGWYIYGRYLSGLTSATTDHNVSLRIGKRF